MLNLVCAIFGFHSDECGMLRIGLTTTLPVVKSIPTHNNNRIQVRCNHHHGRGNK